MKTQTMSMFHPAKLAGALATTFPVLISLMTIEHVLTTEGKQMLFDPKVQFVICYGTAYAGTGGDSGAAAVATVVVMAVMYEMFVRNPNIGKKYFQGNMSQKKADDP